MLVMYILRRLKVTAGRGRGVTVSCVLILRLVVDISDQFGKVARHCGFVLLFLY